MNPKKAEWCAYGTNHGTLWMAGFHFPWSQKHAIEGNTWSHTDYCITMGAKWLAPLPICNPAIRMIVHFFVLRSSTLCLLLWWWCAYSAWIYRDIYARWRNNKMSSWQSRRSFFFMLGGGTGDSWRSPITFVRSSLKTVKFSLSLLSPNIYTR